MPAIKSLLPIQDCHEILKSNSVIRSAGSLFAREIHYPEAVVHMEGNSFVVEQRKSYINPWSFLFRGTLTAEGPESTVIEGQFQKRPVLQAMKYSYGFGLVCVVGAIADILRQFLLTPSALHTMKVMLCGEAALLLTLTMLAFITFRWCEKRYRLMAASERHFVLEYLLKTLRAKAANPSEKWDLPEDEMPAKAA